MTFQSCSSSYYYFLNSSICFLFLINKHSFDIHGPSKKKKKAKQNDLDIEDLSFVPFSFQGQGPRTQLVKEVFQKDSIPKWCVQGK